MSQKLQTKSSLIEWCDKQVAEGKTLSLHWEGGGDSGWVYMEIDDKEVTERDDAEDSPVNQLINLMYDQLDYGSWAGEFSACGEATYDPEQKAFIGIDNYSEDNTEHYECDLQVRVPKALWFDRLEIEVQNEQATISAFFHIRNGFTTEEHDQWIADFEHDFADEVDKVITRFCSDPKTAEYRNVWHTEEINRSDFKEEGDYLVYTIEELNINTESTEEKDICLELESVNDYEDE